MSIVNDLPGGVAIVDGFPVFIAATALQNLVDVCGRRIVLEQLVVLVAVRLAVEKDRLMTGQRTAL